LPQTELNRLHLTPKTSLIHTFRQQLCGVYFSIAEIYLTDLCFEPDAETLCESALQESVYHPRAVSDPMVHAQ